MPVGLLTLFKLVLLLLLYLFLLRVIRTVIRDLYGPSKRKSAPSRRPVAAASAPRKVRRPPRELVVHPPNGRPEVVPLNGTRLTLGRSHAAKVVVDDVYVSDEHTEILPSEDDGWVVRDLGSTNGTFLNGAKVTQPTPLAAGDHLRIGKTRIEVRR